ncbi:MAG: hypothetical protein LBN07_01915 [Christensenellaceae bacterium]|nr:hypothetical protein [Christensenellaceae bacterium]
MAQKQFKIFNKGMHYFDPDKMIITETEADADVVVERLIVNYVRENKEAPFEVKSVKSDHRIITMKKIETRDFYDHFRQERSLVSSPLSWTVTAYHVTVFDVDETAQFLGGGYSPRWDEFRKLEEDMKIEQAESLENFEKEEEKIDMVGIGSNCFGRGVNFKKPEVKKEVPEVVGSIEITGNPIFDEEIRDDVAIFGFSGNEPEIAVVAGEVSVDETTVEAKAAIPPRTWCC